MFQIHTPDSGEANAITFNTPALQPGIESTYCVEYVTVTLWI